MKRKRQLVVPQSIQEWNSLTSQDETKNAYQEDLWQNFMSSRQHIRRPLPASQVLASMAATGNTVTSSSKIPLLKKFLEQIGEHREDDNGNQEEGEKITQVNLLEIDNPSFSTLTVGQHRRFLQLTSSQQNNRRTANERKELNTLTKLVEAENIKYQEALTKFFLDHKDRFLIGFQSSRHSASLFTSWASSYQKIINQRWITEENLPLTFGKCRQIISFEKQQSTCWLDIESLKFQVVYNECKSQQDNNKSLTTTELPPVGTRIMPPSQNCVPVTAWLKDDNKAQQLARQHKANIITTAETLETLLLRPGDFDSKWLVYATAIGDNDARITILDIPIAQSMMPRACLEKGIQEGLSQQLVSSEHDKQQDAPCATRYVYTLWNLPTNTRASRRKPVRVIVRSTIRFLNNSGLPIRFRSHVEYFPERGMENPSLYEKVLWILDQLLLEHNVKTSLVRVNAQSMTIQQIEDTSVAHAFAAVGEKSSNPLLHWQSLVHILQSIPSIDNIPNCLLSLPSQGGDHVDSNFSASVHAPEESTDGRLVHLGPILDQADTVPLNTEILQKCSRGWNWEVKERIPHTFPRQS